MIHVQHFVFNDFLENTYLLWDETGDCIIIDPGCYAAEERQAMLQFIEGNDLKVVLLLNTHCHIDHVLGNKWVMETFNVPFWTHKKEVVVLDTLVNVGKMYGFFVEPSPAPGRFLEEGDEVTFGKAKLSVLFTPGHSPGSISFFAADEQFVIGGDVLFQSSIGRTDLPGGSYRLLMESIMQKLMVLPDEVVVYSGHGPSTTIGIERRNNPFILEYMAELEK